MVHTCKPNCIYIDNYSGCRNEAMQGSWWRRLLRFGMRRRCVLDRSVPPRDGAWYCHEQIKYKEPPAPRRPAMIHEH